MNKLEHKRIAIDFNRLNQGEHKRIAIEECMRDIGFQPHVKEMWLKPDLYIVILTRRQ